MKLKKKKLSQSMLKEHAHTIFLHYLLVNNPVVKKLKQKKVQLRVK